MTQVDERPVTGPHAPPPRRVRRVRRRNLARSRRRTVSLMLMPWVIGFVAFILGPLVASLVLALTNYDIFSPPVWVGLGNVREMFADPEFGHAWLVTVIYGLAGTAYMLILSLITALAIYHARVASGFWRVLYYFPALLVGASQAYVMLAVWAPNGLVNAALHIVGISGPAWLDSTQWALPAVILMQYWTIGTMLLLFLGARASVSAESYEAARMDGARPLQVFRYVTLPMMSPVILVNVVLGIMGSLQAFAQIFILTGGGPQSATDLVAVYIYREAFSNIRMGYGSAVSWSLFLVTLAVTLALLGSSRWWVHYEAGDTL